MKYSEPRYTRDLDVWVHNSTQNCKTLSVWGKRSKSSVLPLNDKVTAETFTDKQVVYQIGIAPVRIDILTEITGARFPEAWRKRVAGTSFPVHFISLDDLVANKQALGRSSALEDLKRTRGSSTPTT
jgi:hypothetical protein